MRTGSSIVRIIADASARIWNGIISFLVLPIFLSLMGPEAFGVVGTFASIQAIISLFDCAMAPALTREVSRARATNTDWSRVRDLARTMEAIYWGLAALAGIIFAFLVPFISDHWLNPQTLTTTEIKHALYLAALGFAFQWPSTLYNGGLVGFEKQKLLAKISIYGSILRAGIMILLLSKVSASLLTFFSFSAFISIFQTLYNRRLFWRSMPKIENQNGKFDFTLLKEIWRFAAGMSIITISSVLLLQTDKMTLSKLLKLENFGYYTISASLANMLYIITGAFFSVTYPKFSELVAAKRISQLTQLYHLSCQGVSALVLPISAVVFFFSRPVLLFWTKNPTVADAGYLILKVFILGNLMNCLMSIPSTVQIAFGLTRTAVIAYLLSLILAVPMILFLFEFYGPLSGPLMWLIVGVGLLITLVSIVEVNFLKGEVSQWLVNDTLIPGIVSFLTAGIFKWLLPTPEGTRIDIGIVISSVWAVTFAATLIVLPDVRRRALEFVQPLIFSRLK